VAATVTLASTTTTRLVAAGDSEIPVASATGILPGLCLYLADSVMGRGELCTVLRVTGLAVAVLRGVEGTATAAHAVGATVTIGRPDQFYRLDPVGAPPLALAVSPWINVLTGTQWLAQGDEVGGGTGLRFWQPVTTTVTPGVLGGRLTTQTPTS
jgi:hypothetical protein